MCSSRCCVVAALIHIIININDPIAHLVAMEQYENISIQLGKTTTQCWRRAPFARIDSKHALKGSIRPVE